MEEKIYFYYTNDLHSNFDQWPRTAAYLKTMRRKHMEKGNACWLFDIGDHMDRVHPISEATMGKANVALMNEVGYSVVTLGNNEGITLSHDGLRELYKEAEFDVVCANLNVINDNPPAWLLESKILQSESGIRIGVIGLTAPFNVYYELLGWHLTQPYEELEKQLDVLEKQSDIIILLSHLGINEDEEIARRFPAVDVILGGHTHHLFRTGEYVNQTLLAAAGKHCMFAGEVILTWDHYQKQLIKKETYTTDISDYPKDENTEKMIFKLQQHADKQLNQTVTEIPARLDVDWFKDNAITQALTDSVKKWTNADVSLLNAGLLLDGFPKGEVTYGDIHRICPHPINAVTVELRGDELLEVVRASFKRDFMELELKGFGFRGEVIGRMHFSGLNVKTKTQKNGEETVKEVTLPDGKPIDKRKNYTVATADTFTFGRLLPEIARSENKHYFLPEFLRDILADTLINLRKEIRNKH